MCKSTHNPINKLNATHILVFLISITYTILSPFAPYRLLSHGLLSGLPRRLLRQCGLYGISSEFVLSFSHTNDVNSSPYITSDTFYNTP